VQLILLKINLHRFQFCIWTQKTSEFGYSWTVTCMSGRVLGGLTCRILDGNFDNITGGALGGAIGRLVGGIMGRVISTVIFAIHESDILFDEATVQAIGVDTCIWALIAASRCATAPLWKRKAIILPSG
jgi:hypothetical protein